MNYHVRSFKKLTGNGIKAAGCTSLQATGMSPNT